MIIVPNSLAKQYLQPQENQPILWLSDYTQTLLDQTPYSLATSTIIDYCLNTLTPYPKLYQPYIDYLLSEDLLDTLKDNPHPNLQSLVTLTKNLLSHLKKHHLIHPKNLYSYLRKANLTLESPLYHFGFKNPSRSLQAFFNHYGISEHEPRSLPSQDTFYTFQTPSDEIRSALHWLNTHKNAAIVYLDPIYQEGLLRHQSRYTPLDSPLLEHVSKPIPKIPPHMASHLLRTLSYPKGLSIPALLSKTHHLKEDLILHYQSIHYPLQTSSDPMDYTTFEKIITDIANDWNLEIPQRLRSLESLSILNAKMSYTDWHTLCFQNRSYRFSLPIYSPDEIQGTRFSHLWILGAHKKAWHRKPKLPWLPTSHIRSQDMSYLKTQADHIIHSRQILGDSGEPLSFYTEDISLSQPKAPPSIAIQPFQNDDASELETFKPSISLVQDYLTCPFKAFSRHRLKLEPKQALSHDLDKRDYGIILHSLLERLYQNIQYTEDLSELSDDLISHHVKSLLRSYELSSPLYQILKDKLTLSAKTWIEKDQTRDAKIIALEYKTQVSIGSYTLNIRIDRLDEIEGQAILIDYKTGHAHIKDSLHPDFIYPQMPIYALTQDHAPQIAYAKPNLPQPIYQSLDLSTLDDYSDLVDTWRQKIQSALLHYEQGHYPVKPANTTVCDQCAFQSLCRYQLEHAHAG